MTSEYLFAGIDHMASPIKSILFDFMSPEEIRKHAVVKVTKDETNENNGRPVVGGLIDTRMGTIDPEIPCATCGLSSEFCPGHPGYVQLASRIYNPKAVNTIKLFLKCFCFHCSSLLEGEPKWLLAIKNSKLRISKLSNRFGSKVLECPKCSAIQPHYRKQQNNQIEYIAKIDGEDITASLLPDVAHEILVKISDQDLKIVGFMNEYGQVKRPENMILTYLPIPPPVSRPTSRTNNRRSDDDITLILGKIISFNNDMAIQLDDIDEKTKEQLIEGLSYAIFTLYDAEKAKKSEKGRVSIKFILNTGRPVRSVHDRISHKKGRIRQNLMGKRVDKSARDVIGPDPNIDVDEVGIPIEIAKEVTILRVVTKLNIEKMYRYLYNGPDKHPGCKQIHRGKRNYSLEYSDRKNIDLKPGDRLECHLNDGDIVFFNRYPSLHRMSMLAHRVKILKVGKSFRLNPSVCFAYNADFDGDEMQMHVPESISTTFEIYHLAGVPAQMITPQTSSPVIGPIQDTIVGIAKLTHNKTWLTKENFMELVMCSTIPITKLPKPAKVEKGIEYWSGRQIVSLLIPPNINLESTHSSHGKYGLDPDNTVTKIVNGIIISGIIDGKLLSPGKMNTLIHLIQIENGIYLACEFINSAMRMANRFLTTEGFSMGPNAMTISDDKQFAVNDEIKKMSIKISEFMESVDSQKISRPVDRTMDEYFELQLVTNLNSVRDKVTDILIDDLKLETNNLLFATITGAKGKMQNISQIMGFLGQQMVEGGRCPKVFLKRALPHFKRYDDSPIARGFVYNSFINGINPFEYFFHILTSREGLIDQAIKTADSGYTSHKAAKALEDIHVEYDNTVRDSSNRIVEFLYGACGLDPMKVEEQPIILAHLSNSELQETLQFSQAEMKSIYGSQISTNVIEMIESEYYQIIEDRKLQQQLITSPYIESKEKFLSAVNVDRLVSNAISMFRTADKLDMTPDYIIMMNNQLCDELQHHFGNMSSDHNKDTKDVFQYATMLFQTAIRYNLASKRVLYEHKLTKEVYDYIINQIRVRFANSIIHPGDMVGIIAGQSIGEKTTQLCVGKDEEILIKVNDQTQKYKIGEFIDRMVELNKSSYPTIDYDDHIMMNIPSSWNMQVMSITSSEKLEWKSITQLSRLPPRGKIVTINTLSGRTITSTLSHAYITRKNSEIVKINGSDLRIGDYIPIAKQLPIIPRQISINIKEYINQSKFIFESEIEKLDQYTTYRLLDLKSQTVSADDDVVIIKNFNTTSIPILEVLPLDYNLGWLFGAILSDGYIGSTTNTFGIHNVSKEFCENFIRFADQYNLNYSMSTKQQKQLLYHYSINNGPLHDFLNNSCGIENRTSCYNKHIPGFAYNAPDEFVSGLLRAYFDGDGHFHYDKNHKTMRAHSCNYALLIDIGLLLNRFGICSRIIKSRDATIKTVDLFELNISGKYGSNFLTKIGLDIPYKHKALELIVMNQARRKPREDRDTIPGIGEVFDRIGTKLQIKHHIGYYARHGSIGRRALEQWIDKIRTISYEMDIDVSDDIELLKQGCNSDVMWDKITDIQIYDPTDTFVYDLSIDQNNTFMLGSGIIVHNTLNAFHLSGVSSAASVISGLPRLGEIMAVRQKIQTPSMVLYLKTPPGKTYDDITREYAENVAKNITYLTLRDICTDVQIEYEKEALKQDDPYDKQVVTDFTQNTPGFAWPRNILKWVIRIEIKTEELIYKQLRMSDIKDAIEEGIPWTYVVYSDDNSPKLIMRIYLTSNFIERTKKITLDSFQNAKNTILDVRLRGITGVQAAYVSDSLKDIKYVDSVTGELKTRKEYEITTKGSNIADVFGHPSIDGVRCSTNDIIETYNVLGLEAAKIIMLNETVEVLSASGVLITHHHLAVLVDKMVAHGHLMSIDRRGLKQFSKSAIAKISFEESVEQILHAAKYGISDSAENVSASIMIGKCFKGGTNTFDLLLDESKIGVKTEDVLTAISAFK
jgi:DNA-directed RNA polymerase beta' subunit/intein/homing endonuclease